MSKEPKTEEKSIFDKISIKEAIEKINSGRMVMPAIQRKYVWNEDKIVKFFDSLMLGYPIGTFIFWEIKKKEANDKSSPFYNYSFYKFINKYDERDIENKLVSKPIAIDEETFFSVLDGQQRLTSLYIALQGSMTTKKKNSHQNNNSAYTEREFYINISDQIDKTSSNESENDDIEETANSLTYKFGFLSEEEFNKKNSDGTETWFKVKDLLAYGNKTELNDFLKEEKFSENASNILKKLYNVLTTKDASCPINYFKIPTNYDMSEILKIFVRVNSGGVTLSTSDLLFSTIVSYWDSGRTDIEKLLKDINSIKITSGNNFKFTNDFIMRTCLYLLDLQVNLKPQNFTEKSVNDIRSDWKNISSSIFQTSKLLIEFGFRQENVVSYNAAIPIVYYIYKNYAKEITKDSELNLDSDEKLELKRYFTVSQLKHIFGKSSNSVLAKIREALKRHLDENTKGKKHKNKFKLNWLQDDLDFNGNDLKINDAFIEDLLNLKKDRYTFMLLTLLYPEIDVGANNKFHQDHMHPYSAFEDENLEKSVGRAKLDEWKKLRNTLPNLQLLEGEKNQSKNDEPLIDWVNRRKKENKDVKYLPNTSLKLEDFEDFYEERRKILKKELEKIFDVKNNP